MSIDSAKYARQSDPEFNHHFRRLWTARPDTSHRIPIETDPDVGLADNLHQQRAEFLMARAEVRLVGGDRLARQVPR